MNDETFVEPSDVNEPGAPESEEIFDAEATEIDNLYDQVMPDLSEGLSVDSVNLAYRNLWDVEFEKWTINREVNRVQRELITRRAVLAFLENKAVLLKENPGTNPETRSAWSKDKFADEYQRIEALSNELAALQVEEAEASMVHMISKSNITRLETILKLAETSMMQSMMSQPAPTPPGPKMPGIITPGNQRAQ